MGSGGDGWGGPGGGAIGVSMGAPGRDGMGWLGDGGGGDGGVRGMGGAFGEGDGSGEGPMWKKLIGNIFGPPAHFVPGHPARSIPSEGRVPDVGEDASYMPRVCGRGQVQS